MLSKAKWFNTYGVSKEKYQKYYDVIQPGNDMSLSILTIADAVVLSLMTAANYAFSWHLDYSFIFAALEIMITFAFFAASKTMPGYHHLFFYMTVEVLIIYGSYAMSLGNVATTFLYPAVAVLHPLFYMHKMLHVSGFFLLNMSAFQLIAYLAPAEDYSYMRKYTFIVMVFTLVGLVIHYVYQSNRLRELINYQDSLEKQNALEITSSFDPLSRLLRRRAFIPLVEHQIKNKPDYKFMMLGIIDIDHFKLINDTYGHQVGDDTVREIGRVLSDELDVGVMMPDSNDFKLDVTHDYGNVIGRLGGDEFIFLVKTASSLEDGVELMKLLIERLNNTSFGEIKTIQGSIGLVPIECNTANYDELYHKADMALYEAKNSGRNRCVVYKEGMEKHSIHTNEDALTGLLEEKVFKADATEVIARSEDELCVIHLNVENFKAFNAKNGFDKGDDLLVGIGKALQSVFEDSLMSRFSGDHFVILTKNHSIESSIELVKFHVKDLMPDFTSVLRVGAFVLPTDKSIDINIACDNAKFACDIIRGRYDVPMQYFNNDLAKSCDKYQYVVEHIDEAIADGDIKVYYQPIIDVNTRMCCGVEALSRWDSKEYGMLPPYDFIETLEQTRLIYKLDEYVVEQVCKDSHIAAEKLAPYVDTVPVSINFSQRDFELIDVVSEVERVVKEYNVPRHKIHIEITESALTENSDHLKSVEKRFEELGYQLWMDDFGAGYSSLNVLKDFQFDVIKLDMGFLKGHAQRSRVILTHVIEMCKELGLGTLIEGIETEEQFEFIQSIGVDYCQGYLFSKPVTREDMFEYYKAERDV